MLKDQVGKVPTGAIEISVYYILSEAKGVTLERLDKLSAKLTRSRQVSRNKIETSWRLSSSSRQNITSASAERVRTLVIVREGLCDAPVAMCVADLELLTGQAGYGVTMELWRLRKMETIA